MKDKKVTVFLPCRKGSERVKNKNTKTFANIEGGLTKVKIQQLIKSKHIDEIIVSTDDENVASICVKELNISNKKFQILERPAHLASSLTTTDELILYAAEVVKNKEIVLWTHVTSPFVNEDIYDRAIELFLLNVEENNYDSLMCVTGIRKCVWSREGKPLNCDRGVEKWPRTQTIEPVYRVNGAIYIAPSVIYQKMEDRIGERPYLFEISDKIAHDIDWEEDFKMAEILWSAK